jgi:glycosyltransferase involved in cell wall biosynthesis
MLSVTIRSCIEALRPLGLENCEIVIADNSDEPTYKLLNSVIPQQYVKENLIKIVRQPFPCLFTARELAAKNSSGKYILCLDSHMLIGHNMFLDLVNFMERNSDNKKLGFAHAPINWAHQHESKSRHDRDMSTHELGDWGIKYEEERKITWKGMPWICRKEFFLETIKAYGALSQHKLSWGGGDMHIGIKPWLLGYENWAVPTTPGIHIGPFPNIDTGKDNSITKVSNAKNPLRYRLYAKSGNGPHTVGFLVSCYVLGGEAMMKRNEKAIKKRFGKFLNLEAWWNRAIHFGKDEKRWLDANKTMSFSELLKTKPWESSLNE